MKRLFITTKNDRTVCFSPNDKLFQTWKTYNNLTPSSRKRLEKLTYSGKYSVVALVRFSCLTVVIKKP